MAAFFTPEQIERFSASVVRCDFLVEFDFATGPKYAWNGNTELPIGDKTYQPMFGAGAIEGLEQAGQGTKSSAVTLSLNGLPGDRLDMLAAALGDTEAVQQRMLTVSIVFFDEDWQVIGVPAPIFFGFMQPPKVSRSPMQGTEGATQSVSLTAENVFFGRARAPNGRYTDRDQQARSPGDKFFGFVSSLVHKVITYPDF